MCASHGCRERYAGESNEKHPGKIIEVVIKYNTTVPSGSLKPIYGVSCCELEILAFIYTRWVTYKDKFVY